MAVDISMYKCQRSGHGDPRVKNLPNDTYSNLIGPRNKVGILRGKKSFKKSK